MNWRLALVQLFFTLGWTVYVIFLPGLLKQAGIEASWLPWILIADQLLFAAADVATGLCLDRSERWLLRVGNWLTVLVLAACTVFVLLPFTAQSMPVLLVAALFVWVICSSVLRVPPLVLLAKYATPQQPASLNSPIAAYLFGLGVAGALAPYLTVVLKNRDPVLPFLIASVALAAAMFALRGQLMKARPAAHPQIEHKASGGLATALPLLFAIALFAFGVQIHAAVNSAKLFSRVAAGVPLEWLMPLFWGGFSIAMFPVSTWLSRSSTPDVAGKTLWIAGLTGGIALVACGTAPPLPLMIALQIIAGAAWGAVFVAAIAFAAQIGRSGREGGWIGATLALMALAAVGRIVLVLTVLPGNAAVAGQLPWLTGAAWLLGAGVLVLTSVRRNRD